MKTWTIGNRRYRHYVTLAGEHVVYTRGRRVGVYASQQEAREAAERDARTQTGGEDE